MIRDTQSKFPSGMLHCFAVWISIKCKSPLCFTSLRYPCLILDVIVPLRFRGSLNLRVLEFSEDSAAVPGLAVRWRTAAGLSRLLQAALIVSIWSCLFCKHLHWLNLLLSVLHESLSSFLFLQSVCLHMPGEKVQLSDEVQKKLWRTRFSHFPCRFATESLFLGKYV